MNVEHHAALRGFKHQPKLPVLQSILMDNLESSVADLPHPDLPVLNHPSTQAVGQRVMSKVWWFYNSQGDLNGPDGFTKRLQTTGDYLCSEMALQPSLR